jgi:hypothetical protein
MFLLSLLTLSFFSMPFQIPPYDRMSLPLRPNPELEVLPRSGLMISQKVLGENEIVMSDLRDVISVWCAEGKFLPLFPS